MADRYWVGGSGNWSDAANHWSDTDGGTPNASFLPTDEDDVYFTPITGGVTVSIDQVVDIKTFLKTTTQTLTLHFLNTSSRIRVKGEWYSVGSILRTVSGSVSETVIEFMGEGVHSILMENINVFGWHQFRLVFNNPDGYWALTGDLLITMINSHIYLQNGHLDLEGYTLRVGNFSTRVGVKTLSLSGGTLQLVTWQNFNPTDFTFNNFGTVLFKTNRSAVTHSISGSFTTFYKVSCEAISTYTRLLLNSVGFKVTNLFSSSSSNSRYRTAVLGTLTTLGGRAIIEAEDIDLHRIDFWAVDFQGGADWDMSSLELGDFGYNIGAVFMAPRTLYWYSDNGNWSNSSKWYSETNGGGTNGFTPMVQDTLVFDQNSFTQASIVTIDYNNSCGNIIMEEITYPVNLRINFISGVFSLVKRGSFLFNSLVDITALQNNHLLILDGSDLSIKAPNSFFNFNVEVNTKSHRMDLLSYTKWLSLRAYHSHFHTNDHTFEAGGLTLQSCLGSFGNSDLFLGGTLFSNISSYSVLFLHLTFLEDNSATLRVYSFNDYISLVGMSLGPGSYLPYRLIFYPNSGDSVFRITTNQHSIRAQEMILHPKVELITLPPQSTSSSYDLKTASLQADGTSDNSVLWTKGGSLSSRRKLLNLSDISFVVNRNEIANIEADPRRPAKALKKQPQAIHRVMGKPAQNIKKINKTSWRAFYALNSVDSGDNLNIIFKNP